jgi:hypothetical protein
MDMVKDFETLLSFCDIFGILGPNRREIKKSE